MHVSINSIYTMLNTQYVVCPVSIWLHFLNPILPRGLNGGNLVARVIHVAPKGLSGMWTHRHWILPSYYKNFVLDDVQNHVTFMGVHMNLLSSENYR